MKCSPQIDLINTFTQRNNINGLELPFFYNKNTDVFVGVFLGGGGYFLYYVCCFFFFLFFFQFKIRAKMQS